MSKLLSRRLVFSGFCFSFAGQALAQTGFAALDTAAITVRDPSRVILQAVTRAGMRLVAVGEHGMIIYSNDDGISWVQAHVPVNVDLTSVAFATPLIGWAAGHFGVVLGTVDGGESWQRQMDGLQANALTLAAAQAAAAAGTSNSPGLPLALRRAGFFVESGPSKPFLSVLALSTTHVIVFGAYRMTVISEDGGRTWSDLSLNIGDRLSHNLYCATAIGQDLYVVGESGMVFCSTDGGQNFPAVTSPSDVTLFGVVGAADGSVVVFGVAGNCFRSSDAGTSWLAVDLATRDNLTAGRRLSNGHLLITGEGGALYRSTDNGQSFEALQGIPRVLMFDIEPSADGWLVVVGQSGALRLTTQNV